MLEHAPCLCEAPLAFLTLATPDRTAVVIPAYRGVQHEFSVLLDGFREPITRTELVAVRPVADRKLVHQADITQDETYASDDPRRRQMADVEGARSVISVPLLRGQVPIGASVLCRREAKPFDKGDIELVRTFAAQAVIAIENARQFREIQTRLEREAATRDILNVISQNRDDEKPVFDVILENAARLCRSTMARLHLLESDGQHRRLVAHWGEELRALSVGETMPMNKGHPISISILESRVFHIEDIAETDLY